MNAGKVLHRLVSPEQAPALGVANYQKVRTLPRAWEVATERLINTEHPRLS